MQVSRQLMESCQWRVGNFHQLGLSNQIPRNQAFQAFWSRATCITVGITFDRHVQMGSQFQLVAHPKPVWED